MTAAFRKIELCSADYEQVSNGIKYECSWFSLRNERVKAYENGHKHRICILQSPIKHFNPDYEVRL